MLKKIARPEAAPPWTFAAAMSAVFAMFLTIIIGTAIAQAILGETEEPSTIVTGWAIGAVGTILFVMAASARRGEEDTSALRLNISPRSLPLLLLFSFGVAILLDLIGWAVGGDQTLASSELINYNRAEVDFFGWLVAALFLVLLQPLADGLVFRGLLLPTLRFTLGPWAGLWMNAGIYAAVHFMLYPPPGDDRAAALWYGFGLPLLVGAYLAGVRAHSNSTRAAILCHAMFGIFWLLKVLAVTG